VPLVPPADRLPTETLLLYPNFPQCRTCELRRISLPKLSKKSGRPQNEGVRSLRNGAKGLISLRYAGDFCARDTTERLFRQFQKVNSRKLRVLLTPGQWCLGKGHDGPRTQIRFPSAPSLSLLAPCCPSLSSRHPCFGPSRCSETDNVTLCTRIQRIKAGAFRSAHQGIVFSGHRTVLLAGSSGDDRRTPASRR
jgi:hypothetical protein